MNEESRPANEIANNAAAPSTESGLLNPELIRRVASLLANEAGATTESPPKDGSEAANASPEKRTAAPAEDALSALLSDPSLLQRLPQIISVMKPLLSVPLSSPTNPAPPPPTQQGKVDSNRDQLLLSLKPFLSSSRCEAIDTMLRIARLGELFGQLK